MTDETHRDSIAEILERIAKEGVDGPRDLDVALDAILSEESAYINRQQARIEELEATILKMGENTAEQAKYYQARIEELLVAGAAITPEKLTDLLDELDMRRFEMRHKSMKGNKDEG